MKKIISLVLVFAFIGCQDITDEANFTSLDGTSDFQDSLSSVVDADAEKVGRRKNKKGEIVKIDVGGKDLQPLRDPSTAILEVSISEEVSTSKEKSADKLDILFYVGGETKNCLNDLVNGVKDTGFISHLDGFDWNVAVSLFPKNPKFISLENNGRKHYVYADKEDRKKRNGWKQFFLNGFLWKDVQILKASEMNTEEAERMFIETLTAELPSYKKNDVESSYDATRDYKVRNTLPVEDFIESLDNLLSNEEGKNFLRKDSKLYVAVIDYEHFPYYTTKEWKELYKKYPTLNIVFLSSRRVNVSNFSHISESSMFSFEWLPKCNRDDISQSLVKALLK